MRSYADCKNVDPRSCPVNFILKEVTSVSDIKLDKKKSFKIKSLTRKSASITVFLDHGWASQFLISQPERLKTSQT